MSSYLMVLFPKRLEPVSQFRASVSFVRKLANEQRKRLGISGNLQRAGIHRIETRVADQFSGHPFATRAALQVPHFVNALATKFSVLPVRGRALC